MSLFLSILALFLIVLIHEIGHLIAARLVGDPTTVLSVGFGPRVIEKRVGDTVYALSLFPFGGFVRTLSMCHESGIERVKGPVLSKLFPRTPLEVEVERDLKAKYPEASELKIWQDIVTLFGGPAANVLFGLGCFFSAAYFIPGFSVPEIPTFRVEVGSPAEAAGLTSQDIVQSINGTTISNSYQAFSEVAKHLSEPLTIEALRDGAPHHFVIIPDEKHPFRDGARYSPHGLAPVYEKTYRTFGQALSTTWELLSNTLKSFLPGKMVDSARSEAPTRTHEQVEGVGIAQTVTQMTTIYRLGLNFFLFHVGVISLLIALVNLLPFPALDGGQIITLLLYGLFPDVITLERARSFTRGGLAILTALSFYLVCLEACFYSSFIF